MTRCEICETSEGPLFTCGDIDQPMLSFCASHYVVHVEEAHNGIPLAGCVSLSEVMARPADTGENDG